MEGEAKGDDEVDPGRVELTGVALSVVLHSSTTLLDPRHSKLK